jgi:hypothetical protein
MIKFLTILLFCVALMSANANADGWTNIKESLSALWEKVAQATKGEIISRETFASEMPRLITAYGEQGILKNELKDLNDGAATYSISVSRIKDQESGRPKLLWIDKINGSEITRYVDINSDGQLDGITNDGSDVILSTLLSALATGDKKMFNAKLQQMGEKAGRYQPMYEADYSRVYFLIKNFDNAPAR